MDCYYHPKNPLVNFCINPNCALPLCPKCINIHLSQSNYTHEIVSINEVIVSMQQQLQIICEGLSRQMESLKGEYGPQTVLMDYKQMIEKFRKEAINQINRHYDYLERQLSSQINARYSHYLQNLLVPIQEQLNSLKKAQKDMSSNNRAIETLIILVSQQNILDAEALLLKAKDKKNIFKSELPRLQDGEGGKLKITAERVEVVSQKYYCPPSNFIHNQFVPSGSGMERIAELECQLKTLRYQH